MCVHAFVCLISVHSRNLVELFLKTTTLSIFSIIEL